MKINWKQLAKSSGYKSLKAAYIKSAMQAGRSANPMRDKKELYANFQWVINRAKHYADHLNRSIESILNEWEEKRTYGILNYYQDCRQPKFNSRSLEPAGIRSIRKYYKKSYRNDPIRIKERIKSFIEYQQRNKPKNDKPRWSASRKRRGY